MLSRQREIEVDVPEGDQVPGGTQPVGFTGKPQLIKYLYWDFTYEVSKILGHRKICQTTTLSKIFLCDFDLCGKISWWLVV